MATEFKASTGNRLSPPVLNYHKGTSRTRCQLKRKTRISSSPQGRPAVERSGHGRRGANPLSLACGGIGPALARASRVRA